MKSIKTTIVGGASISWLAVFMKDLCRSTYMPGGTVVLQDLNEPGLAKMKQFCEKYMAEQNVHFNIETTTNLRDALTDADFVINTVLVGSHDTWKEEINTILRYGLQHPKGMSVGPGGMIMGLKQIPFILALAKLMEEVCPDAWLFNFANPMQLVMLAVQRYSKIKSIGLCHGVKYTFDKIAGRMGIPVQDITFVAGGVNHFETITKMMYKGEDLMPKYIQKLYDDEAESGYTGESIPREIFEIFGGYPTNHDIHVIEFLPYYIRKGSDVTEYHQEVNHIENRIKGRAERWQMLDDYLEGKLPFEQLEKPKTSEYLDKMIDAVMTNTPFLFYGNVINRGYVSNLPNDICVAVPVLISRDGLQGTCVGDLPAGLAEFHALHGAIQRFMVDGAVTGSRASLLAGLSLDPMCYTLTTQERKSLIEELLNLDREFLPNFF